MSNKGVIIAREENHFNTLRQVGQENLGFHAYKVYVSLLTPLAGPMVPTWVTPDISIC